MATVVEPDVATYQQYIDGEWTGAEDGRTYEVINPSLDLCTTTTGRCQGCDVKSGPINLRAFGNTGDLALTGGPGGTLLRVRGMSLKEFCDQSDTEPPAFCGNLPALGPQLLSAHFATLAGFTELICQYGKGNIPWGFTIIETYPTAAAAQAAWTRGGINGQTQPGFSVPVVTGLSCQYGCVRHEFALKGSRIDEIALGPKGPLIPLPSLAQTNIWMHELLTVT